MNDEGTYVLLRKVFSLTVETILPRDVPPYVGMTGKVKRTRRKERRGRRGEESGINKNKKQPGSSVIYLQHSHPKALLHALSLGPKDKIFTHRTQLLSAYF